MQGANFKGGVSLYSMCIMRAVIQKESLLQMRVCRDPEVTAYVALFISGQHLII